jgi:hypothetical protein
MGNEKQQTAVEKLYNEMYKIIEFYAGNEQLDKCMVLLEQAKEIEKERLIGFGELCWKNLLRSDVIMRPRDVYNEAYGGNE